MNATTTSATATYLAQVRAELGDLPATELDEVLEDVADHLEEIGAELDGEPTMEALQARLGTPSEYAEELRTAAGYPPKTPAGTRNGTAGSAALRWGIVATIVAPFLALIGLGLGELFFAMVLWIAGGLIAAMLGVRALRGNDPAIVRAVPLWQRGEGFVRRRADALPASLRRDLVGIGQPVWWVLRGAVGGIVLYGIFTGFFHPFGLFVVSILGALLSIWVGRRSQANRRWLWFVVPANVTTVLALLVLATGGRMWTHTSYGYDATYPTSYSGGSSSLWMDGTEVTNLFMYDRDGRPLKDIRVFDQQGRPIIRPVDCAMEFGEPIGPMLENLWPQPMTVLPDGTCIAAAPPRQTVPPLATPPTKPTASPTR